MFLDMMGDQAEDVGKMMDDPAMVQQMIGQWAQLDDMATSDEKGYKEFINKNKTEFEAEQKKVKEQKEKARIITGTAMCVIKIRPSKIVEQNQNKNISDTIKLFDFEKSQEINKSFIDSPDQGGPLDQPKLYLNMVFHDKVLPPLDKNRKPADPKNDETWAIIPLSFSPNKERWSGSGMKCIHIDGYVNTCVKDMMG